METAKKLDSDFNLGLFDYKPTAEELYRQAEQAARRQANKRLETAFEGFIDKAYNLLCDYLNLLHDWKVTHAPKSFEEMDATSPLFIEACHRLDYTEYLADCLSNADTDEQIGFYKTHREEMFNLADRIKQYANGGKADSPA